LMLLIHPVSADDELDDYVNNQHEKIFSFLKENAEMLSENNRIDLIEKEFSGLISISEISKRVMGKKYFMIATDEQRTRFNDKFKETFFNTYSSALNNLEDQKIEVIGHAHPKDKPNAAIVRVRMTSGEDSYDLTYQMIRKNDRWGVINIIFSGVNIVSIFKTQFSSLAKENNLEISSSVLSAALDGTNEILLQNARQAFEKDLDKVIDSWEISDIRQNS
jgi:phospholipid transport system substrate-binding protein